MNHPRVSIAIVAFNSEHVLGDCLASLTATVASGFSDVTVVDNASPDGCAGLVEGRFPFANLLRAAENGGFAAGCNLAWPSCRGEYWMLLNPDAVVPQGGIENLVAWMDAHPELGAGSPSFVDRLGGRHHAARRFPSVLRSALELTRLHRLMPETKRADYFLGSYFAGGDHLDCDWVPGAALVARRSAVESAGTLSDRLFLYGEDMEWCHRIRRAGLRIGACGSVVFTHAESSSVVRTLGVAERDRRLWCGVNAATKMIRGPVSAFLILILSAVAQAVESLHPGRNAEHRARSRRHLKAILSLLGRTENPS